MDEQRQHISCHQSCKSRLLDGYCPLCRRTVQNYEIESYSVTSPNIRPQTLGDLKRPQEQ